MTSNFLGVGKVIGDIVASGLHAALRRKQPDEPSEQAAEENGVLATSLDWDALQALTDAELARLGLSHGVLALRTAG